MTQGIKPCPFCESEDCAVENEDNYYYNVLCSYCCAGGPVEHTPEEAIRPWNSAPRMASFKFLLEENSKLTRRLAAKHGEIEELKRLQGNAAPG